MPLKRILSLLLMSGGISLVTADLRGAEPGIEFTGYMTDDRGLSVALRDSASGYTKWVLAR